MGRWPGKNSDHPARAAAPGWGNSGLWGVGHLPECYQNRITCAEASSGAQAAVGSWMQMGPPWPSRSKAVSCCLPVPPDCLLVDLLSV